YFCVRSRLLHKHGSGTAEYFGINSVLWKMTYNPFRQQPSTAVIPQYRSIYFHTLTLPSPLHATHCLTSLVLASILFFRPSLTGQSFVSSYGFRNFGFTFFLNREAS